jgi:hypothetical protein
LSGGATAFVAGLVGALAQPAKDEVCITKPERPLLDASCKALVTAVSRALATARTLYERGLGRVSKSDTDAPAFDLAAVLAAPQAAGRKSPIARFKAFDVVPAVEVSSRSPLITSVGTANELAFEFARRGESVLERLPVLRYGDFTTADPQEIENYRAIANLIEMQLATGAPKWRLSLGVFGPPGAGKSFGVKSIARSLVGDSIRVIDANVAQFSSPRDLTREFHSARDETLRGKIPLLFFDEFDTAFQTSPRGWLRFFLAPMQDGMFFDDAREHAIERAIFVFAGGTAKDLSDFYNPDEIETDEDARQQKVPDFVSRLHGVINVRGPDPRPDKTTDPLYALRRATLIRAKLFDYGPNLFEGGNKKGALRIADTVLRALLNVPKYHHGARSIDAIIRMSGITPALEQFEQAMLPSRDQLRLHVNAEKFEEELRR